MEEEIEPSAEYIAAFNLGYKLNRISPEIADLVDHVAVQSDKFKAIKAGISQHKDEIFDSYRLDWLKDERGEEIPKEIDDIEPEKD